VKCLCYAVTGTSINRILVKINALRIFQLGFSSTALILNKCYGNQVTDAKKRQLHTHSIGRVDVGQRQKLAGDLLYFIKNVNDSQKKVLGQFPFWESF
jgi:hypothetical protein